MNPIEQDEDGYTARSIEDLIRNPPEPEAVHVRISDTDRALAAKYGGGATWPPAAPTSTKGAAPFWIERWDAMWGVLVKAGYTQKTQFDRFRKMTEIAKGLRDNASLDALSMAELRRLESAIKRPVVPGAPEWPLWAVPTEVGMLLVYSPKADMQALVDTRHAAALLQIPGGAAAMIRLEVAFQIDVDQAYWSWAAAQLGYLFALDMAEDDGSEGDSKGPKTLTPNMPAVVKPEAPSSAQQGRRR